MINVSGISKSYNGRQVLKDVTFTAKPGEIVALTGLNGSGKSTLLQIMSGMIPADKGSICYFGNEMKSLAQYALYCGYVPQVNGLIEELSVKDNISLWTGKRGKPAGELIRMFDLEDILLKPVKHLSGGMKRRVLIACAMANFPPVLLMDEPTAALDRQYRGMIQEFMSEYVKSNGIIIVSTHDEKEIGMADFKLELKEGISIQTNNLN